MGKSRTTIIAEVGENYIGDLEIAMKMVEEAAKAGADIVKFQSYLGQDVPEFDEEREWFTKVELKDDLHYRLKKWAEENNVQFLSAPFTVERAKFLVEELGIKAVKVASSEMTNHRILDYLNGKIDRLYLSTGLATVDEVLTSLEHVCDIPHVCVMHCVTQYPAQDADANLRAIPTLKNALPQCEIGYSDHTLGMDACLIAVALGAEVLEKHFTLGKELPGTDHMLSVTPGELTELVAKVRLVETLLGDGVKEPRKVELEIRDFVRNRWRKD